MILTWNITKSWKVKKMLETFWKSTILSIASVVWSLGYKEQTKTIGLKKSTMKKSKKKKKQSISSHDKYLFFSTCPFPFQLNSLHKLLVHFAFSRSPTWSNWIKKRENMFDVLMTWKIKKRIWFGNSYKSHPVLPQPTKGVSDKPNRVTHEPGVTLKDSKKHSQLMDQTSQNGWIKDGWQHCNACICFVILGGNMPFF